MKLEPERFPTWKTRLSLETLYYYSASFHFEKARNSLPKLQKALKQFRELEKEEKRLKEKNADYSKLESIAIQIVDNANPLVESSYKPFLEGVALTHILCVASLEAHINVIAKDILSGKILENFDQLSIEGKWLYLPLLSGVSSFNPGIQPFQDFSALIKIRNALVHYKPKIEDFNGEVVPGYLDMLGLSIPRAEISIKVVPAMVSKLAEFLKRPIPLWINDEPFSYFYNIIDGKGEDEFFRRDI